MPTNSTGGVDYNAPCNAYYAIYGQCSEGSTAFWDQQIDQNGDGDSSSPQVSNATERTCICESQFWDQFAGCQACQKDHGAPEGFWLPDDFVSSWSSGYCAATATPTLEFGDNLASIIPTSLSSAANAVLNATVASDPISNKTAVSYYFTPSVTGSAAYIVAEATGSASSSMSVMTSNGQIVATATGARTVGSSSSASGTATGTASGASASSTGSGAGKKEAGAFAGVLGIAALVVLL